MINSTQTKIIPFSSSSRSQNSKKSDAKYWVAGIATSGVITGYISRKIVINKEIKKLKNPTEQEINNLTKLKNKQMPLWAMCVTATALIGGSLAFIEATFGSFKKNTEHVNNK